jgi:REP element-mobilizing transposase RayT
MRHARVRAEGMGCYHVVSRVVDRTFRLDDREKEIFRGMMRRAEAFCGVRVLTYAVLSNHFHLLVEVPFRGEVDEAELVWRMTALYGRAHVALVLRQWEEWRKVGTAYLVEEEQNRMRARMGDISAFVKTLKQRYSMSYNGRHSRKGTFWEERFKSVLVENGEQARATVAAYIDLNPVRAKLVVDPKDYRWSGYGEACAGGKRAREGLVAIHDSRWLEQPDGWRQAARRYRVLLYTAGEERREATGDRVKRPGIAKEEVDRVIETGGKLTLQQALRCRVRYFTDGMAIGGKAFVDGVFEANRRFFGPKRKDGARKMRFAEWGELRTARALRVDPLSAPPPATA